MPLIRYNDNQKLLDALKRFDSQLRSCMKTDIDTQDINRFFGDTQSIGTQNILSLSQTSSAPNWVESGTIPSITEEARTRLRNSIPNINSTNGKIGIEVLKRTILCAFDLTNRGETDKINKQQLYAFLFIMGLPMGFIAKVILDGNLGGVRNGIMKHKGFIAIVFSSYRDLRIRGFYGADSWYNTSDYSYGRLLFYFTRYAYAIGGMNLVKKLLQIQDQRDLVINIGSISGLTLLHQILHYESGERGNIRQGILIYFQDTFESQRGVRRTGQSLSRNRRDVVVIERGRLETITEPTLNRPPASATRTETITQQTQAQVGQEITTLVRDAKFKNTLGVEIEYYDASWTELKEGFKKAKIKLYPRYLGYHERVDYDKYNEWRIMRDGSLTDRFGGGSNESHIAGEIVAPILIGERGLISLAKVLTVCQKIGVTNNNSTGLHVHFGVKGYTGMNPFEHAYDLKTIRNFICNYIGFEKIIDAYVRRSRRRNHHSVYTPSPVIDVFPDKKFMASGGYPDPSKQHDYKPVTLSDIQELSRKFNAMDDREFTNYCVSTLRRGKINPHSNNLAFSIEIRQHGGTVEKDTIVGWILFLHYLFELSKKRVATKFTWKNLRDNVLPKPLWSFIENRIIDMTGQAPDVFDLDPTFMGRNYPNNVNNNIPM